VSLKALLGALGALSILIPCFYSQAQTPQGVLKGTVRDETRKVAIGGAKVQVLNSAGLVLGTSRTGQDGTYLVSGLVVGQNVTGANVPAGSVITSITSIARGIDSRTFVKTWMRKSMFFSCATRPM